MKELISENVGVIFWLVGCVITFLLLDKKEFNFWSVVFIVLSWVTLICTFILMKDKQCKKLNENE